MATRATIAYADNDGSYHAAYLHFDGYPEHAGVILNQRPPKLLLDRGSLMKFARDCDANYLYVFEDGQWRCHNL